MMDKHYLGKKDRRPSPQILLPLKTIKRFISFDMDGKTCSQKYILPDADIADAF